MGTGGQGTKRVVFFFDGQAQAAQVGTLLLFATRGGQTSKTLTDVTTECLQSNFRVVGLKQVLTSTSERVKYSMIFFYIV